MEHLDRNFLFAERNCNCRELFPDELGRHIGIALLKVDFILGVLGFAQYMSWRLG